MNTAGPRSTTRVPVQPQGTGTHGRRCMRAHTHASTHTQNTHKRSHVLRVQQPERACVHAE